MRFTCWMAEEPGGPLVLGERTAAPGPDEVLVRVAGCGVCHTDLGFLYEGVPTRHPFPLTLGHEISGTVVQAGSGASRWDGRSVIVPAVLPCGTCAACRGGYGAVCPDQVFPGNDVHGGFATHVLVPARGLCPVPHLEDPDRNPHGLSLPELSVIADAVSTPYQAVLRSGLEPGDLAVFVGAGGVGGFGAQIAAALGARVVAVDVDPDRLAALEGYGPHRMIPCAELSFRELRKEVRAYAEEREVPSWRHRIFETSGTPAGQRTAFGLLGPGATLSVVGYTPERVEVRLSNLMALHATLEGNWGCLPDHYPAVLDLVLSGKVSLRPFVELRPLEAINETFEQLQRGDLKKRPILTPEA